LIVDVLPVVDAIGTGEETLIHNFALIERLSTHANAPKIPDDEMARLTAEVKADGRYLHASTDALAAAAMQQHIKTLGNEAGGSLLSIRNIPRGVDDQSRSIALRLSMKADSEQFLKFVYALENEKPFIILENLKVSSASWRRQLTKQAPIDSLSVDLTAVGYMQPGRGSKQSAPATGL
jgi:hypothetical protein